MRPRFLGWRALFAGQGLAMLEVSGTGGLWLSSYGGIIEQEVNDRYIIDTGHVVAFEPSLTWRIRGMGSWKSTLFSGEGLVLEFTGRGKVWLQSRGVPATVAWIKPFLPV
jgi:uncharacterized protein (TIGR00266 family)